jgi:hypothetical protein
MSSLPGAYAQSLSMRQLGALGGDLTAANGPRLTQALGAITVDTLRGSTAGLDQGMYLSCEHCDKVTGIDDLEGGVPHTLVKVYPNPFRSILHIEGDAKDRERFELYDLQGRLILAGSLHAPEIKLPILTPGSYQLRIFSKNNQPSGNFIISKE